MKQQERLDDRSQDIEEQLYKLETDKCLVEVRNNTALTWSFWGAKMNSYYLKGVVCSYLNEWLKDFEWQKAIAWDVGRVYCLATLKG